MIKLLEHKYKRGLHHVELWNVLEGFDYVVGV